MEKSQHTATYGRLTAALRRAREAAGLTQAEVASRLGAYASFVCKVESGERRVDVVELAALCRLYEVALADLLTEAGLLEGESHSGGDSAGSGRASGQQS